MQVKEYENSKIASLLSIYKTADGRIIKKYIMMEIKSQNQKCIKEKIKKIHAFSDSNCQSKSPQKIMKVRKFNLLKKFAFLVQRSTKLEFYEMATVYIFLLVSSCGQ